jgi:three-Cys-motif partner protein
MDYLTNPFMAKVDLSNYSDREQAYVKHYLLQTYLPEWAYKVGTKWDSLVYVDGFAGPWETTDPDYADSSFGVAVATLRNCRAGLQSKGFNLSTAAILVESDKDAFSKLDAFAESNNAPGLAVKAIKGKFVNEIPRVNEEIKRAGLHSFKFVLLDPKGWADIPMQKLRPFLSSRSCEVIINLMTKHIVRFLREENRAESYNALFGRLGVLENLQEATGDEKVELAVQEYCRSLQLLCSFRYVSSAVVLEPIRREIKYFLVYATNHPRGVEVFKTAEMKAARIQEVVRQEKQIQKTGQESLFATTESFSLYTLRLRDRYVEKARAKIIQILKDSSSRRFSYETLFCEAMAFPLVTPEDLNGWIDDLDPFVDVHLSRPGRRKPSPMEPDYVVVIDKGSVR